MINDDKSRHHGDSTVASKEPKLSVSHFFGKTLLKQFISMYLALIALFFISTVGNEMLFNSLYYDELHDDQLHDYETVVTLRNLCTD